MQKHVKAVILLTLIAVSSLAVAQNAMYVDPDGNVGIGTSSPSASVDVTRNDKSTQLKVADTSEIVGNLNLLRLENNGGAQVSFKDTTRPYRWDFIGGRDFKINATIFPGTEFVVTREGNLNILGVLSENSDVNAKEKIVPVDQADVLSKIAGLTINEWSYIDTPKERHIGPMAQDFHAAFGLGHGDTQISTLDTAGVALAGIQELIKENDALKAQNSALRQRLESLEKQQLEMQAVMMRVIEKQDPQNVRTNAILN